MPRKKTIPKDLGTAECGYRFCALPDKKFPKKKEDQKFCCDDHRIKEWNLKNPRITENEKNQMPIEFASMEKVTIKHGLPLLPPLGVYSDREDGSNLYDKPKKRKFHYTRIDLVDNKRGKILRKTLEILFKGKPSTREINEYTGSTRASSDVSELRIQGFPIDCISDGELKRFQLTEEGKQKAVLFFRDREL